MLKTQATSRRPKLRHSREQIKRILEHALRAEFPQDTVDISDGYEDNIHVVVVSRKFDGLREREKQERLWKIIDRTPLTDKDKQLISLVYPLSVAEIK
jgi:hypothetical protein